MKTKILLIAIFLVSSSISYSQCKIKTKGKYVKLYEKQIPVEIDLLTKNRILFDKYFVVASNTFVKTTDGDYYYVVHLSRAYSSKFEVFEETPINFYLEDGSMLSLKPPGIIEGKMYITTFHIYLYYKISRKQIEKLATNNILDIKIYFISEKEIENTYEDDLGRFFEFEIHSDKYKNNVFDAANCILQY